MSNVTETKRLRWLGLSNQREELGSTVTDGNRKPVAGVRVVEQNGTWSKDGNRKLDKGQVEIFGDEIHFSNTSTQPEAASFAYKNLNVTPSDRATIGEEIRVTATVENVSDTWGTAYVRFIANDEVFDVVEVEDIAPRSEEVVRSSTSFNENQTAEITVETIAPESVDIVSDGFDLNWTPWG